MPDQTVTIAPDAARGGARGVGPAAEAVALADVVVIGAGQAGLAVAAHLARSGFVPVTDPDRASAGRAPGAPTFVVLDAASGPGGAWRERWPGLTMRTVNGVYELPGAPLPEFAPDEPAARALTRYFGAYERDLDLAVRRPVQVRRVRDLGGPDHLLAVETVERPPVVAPAIVPGPAAVRATAPDPALVPASGPGTPAGNPSAPSVPAASGGRRHGPEAGVPVQEGEDLGGGAGACRPVAGPVPADPALDPTSPGGPARPRVPLPPGDGVREDLAAVTHRRTARTWHARALVNATGTWTRPFWPTYPGTDEFAGTQLHTHDFHLPEDLAGRRVIVVGGGISAVQHLLAIHPVAAATTWVTRRPPDWRDAEFSPEIGRDAVARVDARTRAGLPPQSVVAATGLPLTDAYRAGIVSGVLRARPMFARLVRDGALWDAATAGGPVAPGWETGPEHVTADVVLWATGFRAALDHLRPLGLRDAGGGIVMDGTEVVADPRVQLVGYGPSASTVGANRAGRAAVRQVRRLLGL
ncbi:MAG TPA: NAD(P)-binding domain-containing protein [Cellulomonas sp.]